MKKYHGYRVLFVFAALSVLMFAVVYGHNRYVEEQYRIQSNRVIGGIIQEVRNHYPEIGMEQIISILNSRDMPEDDAYAKYGIDISEEPLILSSESIAERQSQVFAGIMLGYVAALGCVMVLVLYCRRKKIAEIVSYLEAINRREEKLDIDTNTEDEFSLLKNEIYKTAVTLNEQAKLLREDKERLKQSLEDISHQLKTPLTSVGITIDNLIGEPQMEEKTQQIFLRGIQRKIVHINFLVKSLLKLSKFDADVIAFRRENYPVRQILQAACDNVDALCDLKNITIRMRGDLSASLFCDYKWQTEAVTNVIKNSVEHSRPDSAIDITVAANDVFVEIAVRDYGKGISAADKKHIFERFYKRNDDREDSIGIGMALAQTIVEKDNGYIRVESELGEGSTFIFRYL